MSDNESITPPPTSTASDASWEVPEQDGKTPSTKVSNTASEHHEATKPISHSDSDAAKGQTLDPPNETRLPSDKSPAETKPKATKTSISTPTCDPDFNFSDTNIQIRAGDSLFRIHQFKLREFELLRPKIDDATKEERGRKTVKVQESGDDFRNMLVVLYSSAYDFTHFSTATLKSTLRLAHKYAHPALRTFAIKQLEQHSLEPIERFALSRDCGVTEWMSKAIDDLCWREEPITVPEAQILGAEKFVEIAARRETVQFERGSRVAISEAALVPAAVPAAGAKTSTAIGTTDTRRELENILSASNRALTTSKRLQATLARVKSPSEPLTGDVGSASTESAPGINNIQTSPTVTNSAAASPKPAGFGTWRPLPFTLPAVSKPPTFIEPKSSSSTSDLATTGTSSTLKSSVTPKPPSGAS